METLTISAKPARTVAASLLEAAGLPASDLADAHMEHFFYCGPATAPSGLVGLEFSGPDALLRSLVVGADSRDDVLLCQEREELDRGPARHPVGNVPHHRRKHRLRQ